MAKKKSASKAKKSTGAKKASKPKAKKAAPAKKAASKPAAKSASKKPVVPKAGARELSAKATAKTAKATKPVKAAAPKAPAVKTSAPAKSAATGSLENLFTPLDDRVIVETAGEAKRTPGGLYIPDSVEASDRPKQGKVVAVGRGHRDKKGRIRPLDVQLGDTVMFEGYVGAPMKIGERDLVVLRESQVLGIVK